MLTLRTRTIAPSDYPLVMGILNVTPDSFSDGGAWFEAENAVARALEMIHQGADIIDVGPESTRPGAQEVDVDEQLRRAIPVIRGIRAHDHVTPISIDTRFAEVASAAIDAGADLVNDISALRDDPKMIDVVARRSIPVVLMHRRGTSATMQAGGGPEYENVIAEIREFLIERMDFAIRSGVERSRIILDPGIGFGKKLQHNLLIMKHLAEFVSIGQPVLLGASRKRFLGEILKSVNPAALDHPSQREPGSATCAIMAAMSGVAIIRMHEVAAAAQAMLVFRAIRDEASPPLIGSV